MNLKKIIIVIFSLILFILLISLFMIRMPMGVKILGNESYKLNSENLELSKDASPPRLENEEWFEVINKKISNKEEHEKAKKIMEKYSKKNIEQTEKLNEIYNMNTEIGNRGYYIKATIDNKEYLAITPGPTGVRLDNLKVKDVIVKNDEIIINLSLGTAIDMDASQSFVFVKVDKNKIKNKKIIIKSYQ